MPTFSSRLDRRLRPRAVLLPLFLGAVLLLPRTSRAQDPSSPTPPAPAEEPAAPHTDEPPPAALPPPSPEARSGFEASLSLGYAVPSGNATGASGDSLGQSFGGQFPIGLQLGWAVTPAFFIGAYGSVAPGGIGSAANTTCQTYNLSCSSISFHGGLALEYRFNAPRSIQPWVGYGIGYEAASVSLSSSTQSASLSTNGWEYGRFRAGIDFLPLPVVGLGVYVEASVGQYGHLHEQNADGTSYDGDISQTALHEWFSFGIRGRVMP